MFFTELYNWSVASIAVALFLVVEIAFIAWLLLKEARTRLLTLLLLLPLGIGIWTLFVARDGFTLLHSLESQVPAHGKGYFRLLVKRSSIYTATLFHCQLFTLFTTLAALLVLGIWLVTHLKAQRALSTALS